MTYKQFSIRIAREAGEMMRKNFAVGMKKKWKSHEYVGQSPVTKTDLAVNNLLIEKVRKTFPSHDIIGEEKSDRRKSDFVWVCDPVDGTIPFSHGIPTSTFSLALVKNGKPILGAVYDPFMDRLFFAEKGRGAYLNGKKIRVKRSKDLTNRIIAVDLPPKILLDMRLLDNFIHAGAKWICLRSVIYSGTLVACGELASVIFTGPGCHDGAALKILVEEAGGKVTDVYGKEQRYDMPTKGFLATCGGSIHTTMLSLIKKNIITHS